MVPKPIINHPRGHRDIVYHDENDKEKTEIRHSTEDIVKHTLECLSKMKYSIIGCFDSAGPAVLVQAKPVWDSCVNIITTRGIKSRFLTEITAENICYVKEIMRVNEVRHLDGIRINFGIIDKRELEIRFISKEDTSVVHSIFTTVKGIVHSHLYLFEELWQKAIPAEKRIKQIEEEQRLEKRKEKEQARKQREFLDIAVHEIRSPLQPIINYNYLAQNNMIDKKEAIEQIGKHARRLQKLTFDLLTADKIESGDFAFDMGNIKIYDLLLEVANTYRDIIKTSTNGRVSFQLMVDDSSFKKAKVYADKDKLAEVLANILDNAIKYTSEGVVKIEGSVKQAATPPLVKYKNNSRCPLIAEIKISDTGSGIPEKILDNIFERFVTTKHSSSTQGMGLGLYLSKRIVEAHGGDIAAFNNRRNHGATFVVRLPLLEYQR